MHKVCVRFRFYSQFFFIHSFRFLIFEICQSTYEELILYEKYMKKNFAFLLWRRSFFFF